MSAGLFAVEKAFFTIDRESFRAALKASSNPNWAAIPGKSE